MDGLCTLGAALIVAAAVICAALYLGMPVPDDQAADDPAAEPAAELPAEPAAPSFDEHTRTACALLDPDEPCLPDGDPIIAAAVARAVEHLASAVARHRDRAFTGLYRSLTAAELTRALIEALTEPAAERAAVLVNQFRSLPAYHREESR